MHRRDEIQISFCGCTFALCLHSTITWSGLCRDLLQWVTARWEKEHGSYSVIDFREEFEYGVTDNFQIALYLNHHYVYANNDVPAEDPAHPGKRLLGVYETGGEDVRPGHNRATPFDSYHLESVAVEAIYRLLSSYKDPLGLALYFEPTLGDEEKELEWKVIIQKNWFENRFVWALNVNYELEFEKSLRARRQLRMVHRSFLPLRAQLVRRLGILEPS
jgi:hypothetical protein